MQKLYKTLHAKRLIFLIPITCTIWQFPYKDKFLKRKRSDGSLLLSGYSDSNGGPLGPKPSALPTAPHPEIIP